MLAGALVGPFSGQLLEATALVVEGVKASQMVSFYIVRFGVQLSGFRVMLSNALFMRGSRSQALRTQPQQFC